MRKDKDVYQEIQKYLLKEELLSSDNINVQIKNGKVVLSGVVMSLEVSQSIEDAIMGMPGVKIVANDLRIERL